MEHCEPITQDAAELKELAKQAEVELAILMGIEESLRLTLQWMTRGRGNRHKLSTLRFASRSFEQHLTRARVLADFGGYMRLIKDANPHLAGEVEALEKEREVLQTDFERIILRLDYVSPDGTPAFEQVCAELERYLDGLRAHGQKEMALLQHSFAQEEGGSG